jgi:7,8-dihydropterin-6-yl-methyl-4-(beta-D-ribofuranosyl)aminobenzene 5'-phosphate synthase
MALPAQMLHRIPMTRRDFLLASMVLAGTLLVGEPLWHSRRWMAQAQTSAPPVVDRLALRVVVDSYQDALVGSEKVGNIEVQRIGVIPGTGLKKHLHNEFGLSLHLESQRGGETRNFLLDFGFTPGALLNNLDILKVDSAALDALILSHGHFDHFGGLVPFLQRDRARMRGDLPLYVGGESTFCYRWLPFPNGQRESFGVLDRRDLAGAHVRVVIAEKPTVIVGHAFTTGVIQRQGFEKVLPGPVVEIGIKDGVGCNASHFSKEEQEGKIVFDQHWGEHAICFNVKDRGLVVISSCGHRGIINSIRQAQAVSGVQQVHAVMGGFHLSPASEPYIAQTVQALKEIDPDYVIPMHCSGAGFIRMVQREMPDKLILSYTGSRYLFGV